MVRCEPEPCGRSAGACDHGCDVIHVDQDRRAPNAVSRSAINEATVFFPAAMGPVITRSCAIH